MRNFRLLKWLGALFAPVQKNGAFFIFMFALGYLCTQLETPLFLNNAKPYELSASELTADLYVVCTLLALLPRVVRRLVRAVLYLGLYATALVDVYCYVRLQSTLTPTMLMLVGETNRQEASEFLASYLSWDLLSSYVGWVLLVLLIHVAWTLLRRWLRSRLVLPVLNPDVTALLKAVLGVAAAALFVSSVTACWDNKVALQRLFSCHTVGQVEQELTRRDKAELYLPVYRLAFSVYANGLASRQIERLVRDREDVVVDSCSFRIPNIVLVVGESYNKHHSQLYGYAMPTTPRQLQMQQDSSLAVFRDVVAPWNLTSFVFKNILSLHAVGDEGEWCDAPLFPEVFRRAGYHVTFITNQFLPEAKEAVYDFSCGFFLNLPEMSSRLFDCRNTQLHRFDESLLGDYDRLKSQMTDHNLTILHLMGSHTMYKERYPQPARKHLRANMYDRPDLTGKQRLILADYDNSVLYNDSVVWAVTRRLVDQDAVVIYMSDHAEDIFDGPPYFYGRNHSTKIDYRLARNEYEIPFWIWGSPVYRERHPYNWRAIQAAVNRPFMTDLLPHLLLYLGGISCPYYREEYNVISPHYNGQRPRLLKGTTDYNELIK